MILVTLGTQQFQMNRLVEAVDKIAPQLEEEVFIQTGSSAYVPVNCRYADFVDSEKFNGMIEECSMLITHSGVGSIMSGLLKGKPVIVVPRLEKYHEHVDDHQQQIAEAFAGKDCVLYCRDLDRLQEYIEEAKNHKFAPYIIQGGKIEDIILDYLKIFE